MNSSDLLRFVGSQSHYCELRHQVNKEHILVLLNGDLVTNRESNSSGISARSYEAGGWGFASLATNSEADIKKVIEKSYENAKFLSSSKKSSSLYDKSFQFEKEYKSTNSPMTTKEQVEYLKTLHQMAANKYPDLKATQFIIAFHELEKTMVGASGALASHTLPRTSVYMKFSIEVDSEVTSLMSFHGTFGRPEDALPPIAMLEEDMAKLYQQVRDKACGVHAKAGAKDIILAPAVTGILAHEAIGHPAEADLVKAGSVAGNYIGKKVGSDLITMVDYAHSYEGSELPVPVYIDDEGVEAKDATLIKDGVFTGLMNNRELAAEFGHGPTGNARAYAYNDEPLIRMRNTIITPGKSKLDEMISSIDDGYYFTQSSNGQADLTSEFMFGLTMGYEIKNGKLGRAVKDTTISGIAFDMLGTVDMVSDEFETHCTGFCGKKQRMIVSHGGPSIKCRLHVGGR